MKRINAWFVCFAVAALVIALTAARAYSQDNAVVNPKSARVILDNDKVHVLDVVLEPGAKEQVHSHPAYVTYVLAGGKLRSHTTDGKSSEIVFETGKALYRDPLTHWAENIGPTQIHLIVVEIKPAK
jgi:quercetin dioxygenase-like cupin family protein